MSVKIVSMRIKFIAIVLIFICSCSNQAHDGTNSINEVVTPEEVHFEIYSPSKTDSMIERALAFGDTFAYNYVCEHELHRMGNYQRFLYCALSMANKYNYPQAYFDVYLSLTNLTRIRLTQLDSQTKNLALYYLIKASELGNEGAFGIAESLFNDMKMKVPPAEFYLREYIDGNMHK